MSRSFLGSVKDKLSGRSSGQKSGASPYSSSRGIPITAASNVPAAPANVPDEAPPAYSPSAPAVPAAGARGTVSNSRNSSVRSFLANDTDQYAFLSIFDTVFLIDDSASMTGSSWREVDALLRAITPICTARDKDGIDLYFLNHRSSAATAPGEGKAPGGYYNITSPDTVAHIFRSVNPRYSTPTGTRLHSILRHYIRHLTQAGDDAKPVNIIVITDGRPDDEPDEIIASHARKLDSLEAAPHQVGLQFFQVGRDPTASEALRQLDDELPKMGIRDMVDTVSWDGRRDNTLTADGVLKVVMGAVVRRIDRDNNRR